MRAWVFEGGFGYEHLRLRLREGDMPPCPGPRDVLLAMRAAALNYRDLVVLPWPARAAGHPAADPAVRWRGRGGRGRGRGHRSETPGDRVCPKLLPALGRWRAPPADLEERPLGGPLTACGDAPGVSRLGRHPPPDHLADAEAATLPCAGADRWERA